MNAKDSMNASESKESSNDIEDGIKVDDNDGNIPISD
jgi:hypothetical protein